MESWIESDKSKTETKEKEIERKDIRKQIKKGKNIKKK